jgi:hypothetical protein
MRVSSPLLSIYHYSWQQGTSQLFIKWRPVSSTWDSDRLFRWDLTARNIPVIHRIKTCILHLGLWKAVPLGTDNKEHPIYSSNQDLSPPPGTPTGCYVISSPTNMSLKENSRIFCRLENAFLVQVVEHLRLFIQGHNCRGHFITPSSYLLIMKNSLLHPWHFR